MVCPNKMQKRSSKRTSRPRPKRRIFRFLELPAEIRNMIYSHCLTDPRGVYLLPATKNYRRTVERAPPSYMKAIAKLQRQGTQPTDDGSDEEEVGFMMKP